MKSTMTSRIEASTYRRIKEVPKVWVQNIVLCNVHCYYIILTLYKTPNLNPLKLCNIPD